MHRSLLRLWALGLVSLLSTSGCETLSRSAPPPDRPGLLVVAGGGGAPPDLHRETLSRLSGVETRILILPWASERERAGERGRLPWLEAGARTVRIAADERGPFLDQLGASDLLWMTGGSQNRLLERIDTLGLREPIRDAHTGGLAVGGSSAGAAVISPLTLTGEAELDALLSEGTRLVPGLGLWPGVIIDQHFLARRRWARLFAAVAAHPDEVGVGIDEKTAVFVDRGGVVEVIGTGPVVVIDAREMRSTPVATGAPLDAREIRVHLVPAGSPFPGAPR